MWIPLIVAIALMQAPTAVRQEQQAPPQHKGEVIKQAPAVNETPAVVSNLTAPKKQESPKEQPKWWVPHLHHGTSTGQLWYWLSLLDWL